MSKSAQAKSSQSKQSARASTPAVSDRSQLVKSLVDLYVAQDIHHSKNEQKQFFTLIQSHWADMPKSIQSEIGKKLAPRQDLDADLMKLLGIEANVKTVEKAKSSVNTKASKPSVVKKQTEAKPAAKMPAAKISQDKKNAEKPQANQQESSQKSVKAQANTNAKQVASKSAGAGAVVWWGQPALFFGMKLDARQQGLMALSERKFQCASLYSLPSYSFDLFKRNYFANKLDVVQAFLVEHLSVSQEIAKAIIDDKDMLAICIAARALGANEKDITSFVIFNASQFSNPSFDAFDRIKWLAKIPQVAIEQMVHIWQGKLAGAKSVVKPQKSAAASPASALANVRIQLKQQAAVPAKKQFNAASAFSNLAQPKPLVPNTKGGMLVVKKPAPQPKK